MFRVFTDLLDTFCPIKTVTIKKDRPPYITNEILELGRERDRLFKIARKTKADADWRAARQQRQLANYSLRRAKTVYYKGILIECRDDSRKFWAKVKELLPLKICADINVITNQEIKKHTAILLGLRLVIILIPFSVILVINLLKNCLNVRILLTLLMKISGIHMSGEVVFSEKTGTG